MPRFTAPPPSNEVSITLTKPFSKFRLASAPPFPDLMGFSTDGTATKKIEIFGEPNRSATIKVHTHTGGNQNTMMTQVGDINEYVLHFINTTLPF